MGKSRTGRVSKGDRCVNRRKNGLEKGGQRRIASCVAGEIAVKPLKMRLVTFMSTDDETHTSHPEGGNFYYLLGGSGYEYR